MKKLISVVGFIVRNIKLILKKNAEDNVAAIAAHSAFFIILSFVPFMIFAASLLSVMGIPEDALKDFLDRELFESAGDYVNMVFREIYPNAAGIAVTTVILALWSAGKGIFSVTEGIKVVYKIPNRYNWFVKRVFSMGYTLIMFLAVMLVLSGTVVTEFFNGMLSPLISELSDSVILVYTLRYLLVFAVASVLIAFALKLYLWRRIEDKRFSKFRVLLPGAFFTSAGWLGLSLVIRIYVNNFDGYSFYGSLGAFAMMMIWMYFSMYLFICGVQINYIYRHEFYNFRLTKIFKIKS